MGKTRCGIFLLITIAIIFLTFGISTDWKFTCTNENDMSFKKCSEQYPFVSDELDCGTINEKIEQVENLDEAVEKIINSYEQSGRISRASVFYRDLKSRRWFGVNENVNFYPASLAKLPIAMMVYKSSEVNKKILDAELQITDDDTSLNEGQHYKPQKSLEAGKSYPVKELLHSMLTYSDNAPVNPLLESSKLFHNSIFSDLGVYYPAESDKEEGQWNITTKNYANLFRSLYNSSYLKPQYSNEILSYLSESTFEKGIRLGVDKNVKIANKYGESSYAEETDGKTLTVLNDCGIIYKQENPYILCIMTLGENYENLEKLIGEISREVYVH